MTGKEALEALLAAVRAIRERRGDMTHSLGSLEAGIAEALNPSAFTCRPPAVPKLAVEPDYPCLVVLYRVNTGQAIEYKVVHTIHEHVPFMGPGKEAGTRWFKRPMSELSDVMTSAERLVGTAPSGACVLGGTSGICRLPARRANRSSRVYA